MNKSRSPKYRSLPKKVVMGTASLVGNPSHNYIEISERYPEGVSISYFLECPYCGSMNEVGAISCMGCGGSQEKARLARREL